MLVNAVTVYVKPEHIADFIAASMENHAGSRQESGNFRFDVLQSSDDPARFLLYEVFASQAAVEEHRKTAHYLAWKTKVEPWMAKPREPRWHTIVAPTDPASW